VIFFFKNPLNLKHIFFNFFAILGGRHFYYWTCDLISRYHITLSGSGVIKLFFETAEFSRNYMFENLKFKEITREGKCCKKTYK